MVYTNLLVLVLNKNSYKSNLHHYVSFDKLTNKTTSIPYIHLIRYDEETIDDSKCTKDDKICIAKTKIDELFEDNKPMMITNYDFKKEDTHIYEIPSVILDNMILLMNDQLHGINTNMKQKLNKKQEQVITRINKIYPWKKQVIYKEKEKNIYLGDLIYKYMEQNVTLKNEKVHIVILHYNILFTENECAIIKNKLNRAIDFLDSNINACRMNPKICEKQDELYNDFNERWEHVMGILSTNVDIGRDFAYKNMKSLFDKYKTSSKLSEKQVDVLTQRINETGYNLNQDYINNNKIKWKQIIDNNDTNWRYFFNLQPKHSEKNPDENCCIEVKTPKLQRKNGHFTAKEGCDGDGWIELKGLEHELYYNKCSELFRFEKPNQLKEGGSDSISAYGVQYKEKKIFRDLYHMGGIVSPTVANGLVIYENIKQIINTYKIKDFGGGGDCLFKSIAGILNVLDSENNYTHITVRNKIVNKMDELNNKKLKPFEDTINVSDKDNIARSIQAIQRQNNRYIENMGKLQTWGTMLEIQTASLVFGINIHVFINGTEVDNHGYIQNTKGNLIPISYMEGAIQKNNKYDILLFSNASSKGEGNHYQGIIPKDVKSWHKQNIQFINWKYLNEKTGSGKQKKRTKKRKSKIKTKQSRKRKNH